MTTKYAANWINPVDFEEADLPIVVLVDNRRGWLGWLIKEHEGGNYNHSMIMRRPGYVVTQNNVLKEIPIAEYLKSSIFLKFWQPVMTNEERDAVNKLIDSDLSKPWWQRMYDVLGILGQAIWIPWISTPGLYICSEWTARILRVMPRFKLWMPEQPSPSDQNKLFDDHAANIKTVGYWFAG